MRIGVCASPDRWGNVAAAGYDYVEGNFSKIAMATDEEFEEMKSALAASRLKMEATNGFFPSAFTLYSKDDFESVRKNVREYCERGFARGAELGQRVAVIGSSGARNIREGYTKDEAEEQFCEVLRICGEVGLKYGVAVTVEPLNAKETNFIITRRMARSCRHLTAPRVSLSTPTWRAPTDRRPHKTTRRRSTRRSRT